MILICNAGPTIALAKIDHLSLLNDLADQVYIPEVVLREVLAKPGRDANRIISVSRAWLRPHAPVAISDPIIVDATRKLDEGEKQVIEVASSMPIPVTAVLDDAAGRRTAKMLRIAVIGFPGLLLIAKKRNLIASVSPLLVEARLQGYWLSDKLLETVKKLAGE